MAIDRAEQTWPESTYANIPELVDEPQTNIYSALDRHSCNRCGRTGV